MQLQMLMKMVKTDLKFLKLMVKDLICRKQFLSQTEADMQNYLNGQMVIKETKTEMDILLL